MAPPDTTFTMNDAALSALEGQRVAIVGYGHLGRPAALNLRDAGLDVFVASRDEDATAVARADRFDVVSIDDAIATADVVWLALPDEVIPEVLSTSAPSRPRPGSVLCFSSGYSLAYGLVKLPEDVDAVLLAPRMLGIKLRELYEAGEGFYSFVGVEQDASGTARARLHALAQAFGTLRRGVIEISAATEAALDLFVEQSVGPYLGAAVLSAFDVGIGHGLPPTALALELYLSGEMARTWQTFADVGFFPGVRLHGHAASFGGFVRMGELDVEAMKCQFAATLEEISSGHFARRFQDELAAGSPTRELIEAMIGGDDPLSRAEAALLGAPAT
jgi:ketol-acid reductoisomerase